MLFFFFFEIKCARVSVEAGYGSWLDILSVISCSSLSRSPLWLSDCFWLQTCDFPGASISPRKQRWPRKCAVPVQFLCQKIYFSLPEAFFPPESYFQFKSFQQWLWSNPSALSLPIFLAENALHCELEAIKPGSIAHQRSTGCLQLSSKTAFLEPCREELSEQMGQESTLFSVGLESELIIQPVVCHTGLVNQWLVWKINLGKWRLAGCERCGARHVGVVQQESLLGMRDREGAWRGRAFINRQQKVSLKNDRKSSFWESKKESCGEEPHFKAGSAIWTHLRWECHFLRSFVLARIS